MKITILCENQAGHSGSRFFLAEWGLSLYVQTQDINLLFDTGHTGVYQHNAKQLGLNLDRTNFIVLSHHHWDHVGGLQHHGFKTKKKLIVHPELIVKLPAKESRKIKQDFKVIASAEPLEFSRGIYYLGEIPRQSSFEKGTFKNERMPDDSAVAIKTKKGTVVVTGCSHSGICNICEYAKKVTGQRIYAVIGGFHLFENNPKAVAGAIKYFKTEKPRFIYPMHCIDLPTLARFHGEFGITKLSAGDKIKI
ncbi:MAG: MBL fold metallo-hydrolase [Candidatus Edwardsbacteria bacterium]|nr:MBL fold metallo-hydrolase [Candidatus Edwardsbacteria bacterium]MBU1576051.1 MBL fold metallo-hydrolase [Candidatus Edwardsbacteria bacterium]MBU2463708.1 MBL fold metallo-hydrolase [Candidatus Edwardsbacteria bacterium]MBU2594326.1 MBL fold metallo-hydrolase [Candidatus Edwardsbacteria bacterium]